jgi:phospholipid transport system substrate-binding protein
MRNNVNRRWFLAATAAFTTLASPVLAFSEPEARKLVDTVVAEINRVIASGKSEAAMINDFEKLFSRYADVPIMAQYALGNDGRSATSRQKAEFATAFQGYISKKYGQRFREFIGGSIEVKGTRAIKSGYEVQGTAYLRGQRPFDVTFLVSDKSGSPRFFNIFIEGVNLLLTERTEIGAMLDRRGGDIDKLIADVSALG